MATRPESVRIIPGRVVQARLDLDVSQEALARRINCSLSSVQAWEYGRSSPGPRMLQRLVAATGKPAAFFLSEDGVAA